MPLTSTPTLSLDLRLNAAQAEHLGQQLSLESSLCFRPEVEAEHQKQTFLEASLLRALSRQEEGRAVVTPFHREGKQSSGAVIEVQWQRGF